MTWHEHQELETLGDGEPGRGESKELQAAERLLRDKDGSWYPDSMFESLQSEDDLYERYIAEISHRRRSLHF